MAERALPPVCVPAELGGPDDSNISVPTGPDGGTAESTYTPPSTQGSFGSGGGGDRDGGGGIVEGCGDGGDAGAGDKLLHLLRRWDIQNVVLCVTCWDDGLRGRLGSGRFRLYLDSAKSVLEQCYLDSVSVASSSAVGDQGSREASKEDSLGDEDGGRSSDNTTASSSGIASSGSSRLTVGGTVAERAWSNRAVRPKCRGQAHHNNNQEDMEEQEQRSGGARSSRQFRPEALICCVPTRSASTVHAGATAISRPEAQRC